jgi:hypothetical protein
MRMPGRIMKLFQGFTPICRLFCSECKFTKYTSLQLQQGFLKRILRHLQMINNAKSLAKPILLKIS